MADAISPIEFPWQQVSSEGRLDAIEGRLSGQKDRGACPTKVLDAARAFESFVIEYMFKTMDKSVERSDLFGGGHAEAISRSMLYEEYAKSATKAGGLGLADAILDQLLSADKVPGQGPGQLRSPVEGIVSSDFGYRADPFTGKRAFHSGIDIARPAGTEIRSCAAGKVTFSGIRADMGHIVEIDHGQGYTTCYAHNASNLVRQGETVQQGQVIALVGMTGRSTGPHLHFELRRDGVAVDPKIFLDPGEKNAKVIHSNADNR